MTVLLRLDSKDRENETKCKYTFNKDKWHNKVSELWVKTSKHFFYGKGLSRGLRTLNTEQNVFF